MLGESQTLFDRWPQMEFDDKRLVIENFSPNIVVGKEGEVAIEMAFFPGYEGLNNEQRTMWNAAFPLRLRFHCAGSFRIHSWFST